MLWRDWKDLVPTQRAQPPSPPCGRTDTCAGPGRGLRFLLQEGAEAGPGGGAAACARNLIDLHLGEEKPLSLLGPPAWAGANLVFRLQQQSEKLLQYSGKSSTGF